MANFYKPNFIRKLDFFDYFNKPRDQWFFKETYLEDYIKSKTSKMLDIETEEESESYDPLEFLRLSILNGETIDVRDPKIYEGNLIDNKSRDFIKLKYLRLNAYDFDELYKGINSLQYLSEETKKFLLKDNFILFQPVFIFENRAVARPDALIKEKGKYTIIEVKGTLKPKLKHLVDLVYQHHIVNAVLEEFNQKIDNYLLCVIKYIKNIKGKFEFEITDRIPLVKSGKDWGKKIKDRYSGILKYSDAAIDDRRLAILNDDLNFTISDIIQQRATDLNGHQQKNYKHILEILSIKRFQEIIDILQAHEPKDEPSLLPDFEHFKSWFDEYRLLKTLYKYYFSNEKFLALQWSGNVVNLSLQNKAYLNHKDQNLEMFCDYVKKAIEGANIDRFLENFQDPRYTNFNIGVYRTNETKKLFQSLKKHKVYFDFESINPATCVVEDTVPYSQIVTQVSIIKDQEDAINIVKDPQKMTVEDFKEIIDLIYNGHEYNYVVYNKTFECSRLNEMAGLINDVQYTKKVEIINQNIYDLCDFFNPKHSDGQLITIRELKGHYSIKNILPIVQREILEIFKQVGAVDYSSLEGIHHGGEALNQTSRRFFKIINDQQWETIVEQLKRYCENDVRAMIALEKYIGHILNLAD